MSNESYAKKILGKYYRNGSVRMKEVISNKNLRKVMIDATNLICDAVSSSLGPSGNNVIIDMSDEPVFITNDGVTIAKSIESDDKKVNAILNIIKESSLKTDEKVGDGTTTTLVLLQNILIRCLEEIEKGKNPITLKKEILNSLERVIEELKDEKRKPTKEDLTNVATISSNDKEIGKIVSEVYFKMNNKYAIKIEEGKEDTYYHIKKGYTIDMDGIPNMYFEEKDEIELNNSLVLILRGYLENFNDISEIINEYLERNKNVVIFSEDFDESLINESYVYNLKYNTNLYIFKLPNYGSRKNAIEEDISYLTNSKIVDINLIDVHFNDLGSSKNIIIKKENLTIISDKDCDDRILKLESELENIVDEYEREFIEERLAKLKNGIATIYVGGITKTEKKEKIMRYIDALNSIEVAKHGIIPGEGIALLKISRKIDNNIIGDKILRESLELPFKKIIENVGEDYNTISNKIIDSNFNQIYNFDTNKYENVSNTKIIDPVNVTIEALKNSCSIACMLFTTNYLIINENLVTDNAIL